MYCTKCGAKIADDARFCVQCGSKIGWHIKDLNIKKRYFIWLIIVVWFACLISSGLTAVFGPIYDVPVFYETQGLKRVLEQSEDEFLEIKYEFYRDYEDIPLSERIETEKFIKETTEFLNNPSMLVCRNYLEEYGDWMGEENAYYRAINNLDKQLWLCTMCLLISIVHLSIRSLSIIKKDRKIAYEDIWMASLFCIAYGGIVRAGIIIISSIIAYVLHTKGAKNDNS